MTRGHALTVNETVFINTRMNRKSINTRMNGKSIEGLQKWIPYIGQMDKCFSGYAAIR